MNKIGVLGHSPTYKKWGKHRLKKVGNHRLIKSGASIYL